MKNNKLTSKHVNKQASKKEKRPLNKDDFDFVLTGVTKPLKEQDKKESGKT
ncbi:hypothetical protein ES705_35196 [subsurface metagenome]